MDKIWEKINIGGDIPVNWKLQPKEMQNMTQSLNGNQSTM
jgi:hypothetical protein